MSLSGPYRGGQMPLGHLSAEKEIEHYIRKNLKISIFFERSFPCLWEAASLPASRQRMHRHRITDIFFDGVSVRRPQSAENRRQRSTEESEAAKARVLDCVVNS